MNKTSKELRSEVMDRVAERAERGFNDTRYDWIRSKPRRRLLVVGTAITLAGYAIAQVGDVPLLGLASIIGYMVALWLLRVSVRHVVDLPDEIVDERMREERGLVYRWSYLTAMTLMSVYMAIYIVNQLMVKAGWVAPLSGENMHDLSFVLFFTCLAVPGALYAWNQDEV